MPSWSPVYYYTTCAWCHCQRAVRGTYVWTAAPFERLLARRRRWEKKIPSQFVFELYSSSSSHGGNTYTCFQLTAKETTGRREPINPHRYIPDTRGYLPIYNMTDVDRRRRRRVCCKTPRCRHE